MHTLVFVLVPEDAPDVEGTVRALLEPYRLDEDDPGQPWPRWDYWIFGGNWDGMFRQGRVPDGASCSWRHNVIRAADLPAEHDCGALLTPDGELHREWMSFPMQGSDAHERARRIWLEQGRPLVLRHADHLVVAVDMHT